ncbi:MAG: hypothetical protein IKZ99_02540, partial [Salinivirgaceae bacterium]|nr:hypothetical protein [Salinivirgaceae bacterium]
VVQKGSTIYVYDEKGSTIGVRSVGSNAQLMGYTGSSFSVKEGNTVYIYDEKGSTLSVRSV